jgi:Peptidase family M28
MRVVVALLVIWCVACGGAPARDAAASATPARATETPATPSPSAAPTATPSPSPSPTPAAKPIADVIAQIDQSKMDAHLKALTDVGSRDPRHPGHAKAVAYIKGELAKIPGIFVTDHQTAYQGIPLLNILVTVPPEGPAREGFLGGVGLLCAHYDSTANRTAGWKPATDPAPGADDNGTGTAALLELARILAADRTSLNHPVVLAFFDGEELFFKGSAAYLLQAPQPNPFKWVINLDMVGFNPIADRLDLIYYTQRSVALRDRVKVANQKYAIGVSPLVEQLATSGETILDAAPFGLAGIPSVALVQRYGENDATFPGNYTFHTVRDTPDKITNKRLWMKASRLVLATALELLRGDERV